MTKKGFEAIGTLIQTALPTITQTEEVQVAPPKVNLKIEDGGVYDLTFTYGNCTRIASREGSGYYYRFETPNGRVNANGYLLKAILDNWPGREGSLRVARASTREYQITNVEPSEYAQYPLEMKEWDDQQGSFVTVDFSVPGAENTPSQTAPATTATPSRPARPTNDEWDWPTLTTLMGHCLQQAHEAWNANGQLTTLDGDHAGAVERMAVTFYLDARKLGLTSPRPDSERGNQASSTEDEIPF